MRILRTVLVLATILVAFFATVQWAGRGLFSQLPRLEGLINDALAGQGIAVRGLEGRWRGLNPGFFADSIRFPAGEFIGFDFEFDVGESLARNRVVARRMTIADGRLMVEKSAAGWRLRGSDPDFKGFSATDLLIYSDQVWLRGRIVAEDKSHSATLYVESMLLNADGQHRFAIRLQSEPQCADCALMIEGDVPDNGPGAIRILAESFSPGRELDEMLGLPPFELALSGDWRRDADGDARARLAVRVADLQLAGAPVAVDAELGAWNERGGYRGKVDRLSIASGDHVVELAGGGFRLGGPAFEGAPGDETFAEFWLPPVAIADISAMLVAAVGHEHPMGRWLGNLAPIGEMDRFAARIDGQGLAFVSTGTGAALAAYQGAPEVDNVSFTIGGHARALRADLDARNFRLVFPDFVPASGLHRSGSGSLTIAFGTGHRGLRGEMGIEKDGSRIAAGFALARSSGVDDGGIAADAIVDRIAAPSARDYLPWKLAPGLRTWLQDRVQAGELTDNRLLYRGDLKQVPGLATRRFEMSANVVGGVIDYHVGWPRASRVDGSFTVTGRETVLRGQARVFGVDVTDLEVRVPVGGERASVRLRAQTEVDRLMEFAWQTPVGEAMPFLSEQWVGTGRVGLVAAVSLPLRGQALEPSDMRFDFTFENASIDLVDLGLHIDAMNKQVGFEWPNHVASDPSEGTLFGAPVRIAINSDDDRVSFSVDGSATVADVVRLLDVADPGVARGRFEFDATFNVFPGSDRAAELHLESDLAGVDVSLPAPLGKAAPEPREFAAALQFLDDYTAVSVRYGTASGWIHADENRIRAAALGIGAPPPMADADAGRVVVRGGLEAVDGADIRAFVDGFRGDDGAAKEDRLAWELRKFRIAKVVLDAVELEDLVLDGYSDAGEVSFSIASAAVTGTVARSGNDPWQVQLSEVKLPAADTEGDPLDPALIDSLVAADVVLDSVRVGDHDYGSWRFGLRPVAGGVQLIDVLADLRGLHIEASAPAFWSNNGESLFEGTVTAGDLQIVLPLWAFAPSIESESFRAVGALRWPGSPMHFGSARLSGEASLELTDGRFLDVDQGGGATRIMSLINFSTIVKRMSLDFSDVFGRGVSFDRVTAALELEDGLARFTEPAKITGTGMRFEISGEVNLASGALSNEMVVTLPLHTSLPWYAAVLALSNPAAAAGVLFGQQVFKDPIKRLTSGMYRIGGTYDEPEVEFVRMFDNVASAANAPVPQDGVAGNGGARTGDSADEAEPASTTTEDSQ